MTSSSSSPSLSLVLSSSSHRNRDDMGDYPHQRNNTNDDVDDDHMDQDSDGAAGMMELEMVPSGSTTAAAGAAAAAAATAPVVVETVVPMVDGIDHDDGDGREKPEEVVSVGIDGGEEEGDMYIYDEEQLPDEWVFTLYVPARAFNNNNNNNNNNSTPYRGTTTPMTSAVAASTTTGTTTTTVTTTATATAAATLTNPKDATIQTTTTESSSTSFLVDGDNSNNKNNNDYDTHDSDINASNLLLSYVPIQLRQIQPTHPRSTRLTQNWQRLKRNRRGGDDGGEDDDEGDDDGHPQTQDGGGGDGGGLSTPLTMPGVFGSPDDDERVALLQKQQQQQQQSSLSKRPVHGSPSAMHDSEFRHGWYFSSPYWSLGSRNLVTITYRPAWQAIPEFTQSPIRCTKSSAWNMITDCCGCGDSIADRLEYWQETYTTDDIVRVEIWNDGKGSEDGTATATTKQNPPLMIDGIGACHAVRLYLRPMTMTQDDDHNDSWTRVPTSLAMPWQRTVQRMRNCSDANGAGRLPNRDNDPVEHHAATVAVAASQHNGPILTFALSQTQTDPPLLWKVQLPSRMTAVVPLAVETISILDGPLVTMQTSSAAAAEPPLRTSANDNKNSSRPQPSLTSTAVHRGRHSISSTKPTTAQRRCRQPASRRGKQHQHQQDPTHIFVHGWQSWSFTGSVARGQAQPRSAMPAVFSRAFNAGGAPPSWRNTTVLMPANSSLSTSTRMLRPLSHPCYQSDFYTCITSDGLVPTSRLLPNFVVGGQHAEERDMAFQQLDERGGPALMLGWLSQRQQFGVINADKALQQFQMHCSAQGQIMMHGVTQHDIVTDWAYCQLVAPHSYDEEPMVHYLHATAAYNHARPLQNGTILTGWCSWYVFYEKINATLLRDNVATLASLRTQVPTNVTVVDDGYMRAWGDWDDIRPKDFPPPTGLQAVAADIAAHGMRPGLWLAPFAADKHSRLAKQHNDWIIRNDTGCAANSSNCGKFFYGLDATNPAVRDYVRDCIYRATQNWKFNVLKIDFLYAACLEGNGKHDLSLSRAQAMHLALQTIRQAAGPNVFLIGCGCPIGSGIGLVDAMRVSADTGPTWYPAMPLPYWDNGTLPALRSMVRNSIARAPLGHRWWHNDPDCLMLGQHTRLTDEEVASAASVVAMTCGMLLLSDDLPKVSRNRMRILSKIFPLTGVPAAVLDLHSTNNTMPSLMRLWCSDRYNLFDSFHDGMEDVIFEQQQQQERSDHNAEATFYARRASFCPDTEIPHPNERRRSCIHVTRGMGTWTVVSVSNWSDRASVVHVPPPALLPPPSDYDDDNNNATDRRGMVHTSDSFLPLADMVDPAIAGSTKSPTYYGFHVFAFWSSKYSWIADIARRSSGDDDHHHASLSATTAKTTRQTISKLLLPHETEIFHIKPVLPDTPQYIGSDFHFTCGQEVRSIHTTEHALYIFLKTGYHRAGNIYVFVPRVNLHTIQITVRGGERESRWSTVGNTPKVGENGSHRLLGRIIRIAISIQANGSPHDGEVRIDF